MFVFARVSDMFSYRHYVPCMSLTVCVGSWVNRTVATVGEGDSNFARNQRMSAAEMMQRKTRLCKEIWQRQVFTTTIA